MKMRSQWRRVGPNPMTGVIRRKKCGHTRRAEDHVKTEMETGVTLPHEPRNTQEPVKAGGAAGAGGVRWGLVKEAGDCPACLSLQKP